MFNVSIQKLRHRPHRPHLRRIGSELLGVSQGLVPHLLVPAENDAGDDESQRFTCDGDGDGGLLLQVRCSQ